MSQPPPSLASNFGISPPSSNLPLPSFSSAPQLYDEVHPYLHDLFTSSTTSSSFISSRHYELLVVSEGPSMLDPSNPINSILQPPYNLSSNPQFFETDSYSHNDYYPNAHQFNHTHLTFNNSTPPIPSTLHPPLAQARQVLLPPMLVAPNYYPDAFSHPFYASQPVSQAPASMTIQQSTTHPTSSHTHQVIEPPPALPEEPSGWESLVAQVNILQPGQECTVCFGSLDMGELAIQLPCSHLYHRDCIAPWMERRGSCPYCRRQVMEMEPTNDAEEDVDDDDSDSTFVTDSEWEFDEELLDELTACWELEDADN